MKEVVLTRSAVTGPAVRVVLDRRALARLLALGCTELRLTPGKAVAGAGAGVTVLAAPLDPELAADTPTAEALPIKRDPDPDPERRAAMKPHEANGHAPGGRPDPPAEATDPLAVAEELRAALGDALTRAARLVAALKAPKREKKALVNLYSSLKQLNLDQP